ncbi:hypothetical protein ARMGADRAFT_1065429 [Armillaria gallica]|uniref:Uncharacterized protein n=1 Tax=Armillaria gallica TaxID=47427 RepID=A0A2H3D4N1_ARMGA|nr:hypothetical protein ARMGADRAFT_1065429 [Armillaria gallica]
MASSTSSSTAISKGIARPNTDHLMLELKGYDEWDFIDGYTRGFEVSESGSSEWTLTQATDQGQYPFSESSSTDSVGNGLDETEHTISRRRFGRVAQAQVSSEAEAHNSAPTLLLKPRRKVLESRTYQAGREVRRRYNRERFNGEKDSNHRVQYEQVEIDTADWSSTHTQPSGIWVALQG